VEDSMSLVHASRGIQAPLSPLMRSEPAIVAGLGAALLGEAAVRWHWLAEDHARIRDAIERCQRGVFDGFDDYNAKLLQPGGFWLPNAAARREWRTASGKAQLVPQALPEQGAVARACARLAEADRAQVLTLMTVRSHDQFNTTVYGQDDRYRNVFGTRTVVFVNEGDGRRLELSESQSVDLEGLAIDDGQTRWLRGFEVRWLDIAPGCAAAYFPEATPLVPLGLVAQGARTPAAKALPIRLHPAA
jgi:anaerobic selenocysteine-containing dehydrogenase